VPANIVLQTFTLMPTGGGTAVTARVLAQSGVTVSGETPPTLAADANIPAPGILVLLPISSLQANTSYTVTFSATVNGSVAVNRTWTFTTGSTNLTSSAR
jgi:hypothetical protein